MLVTVTPFLISTMIIFSMYFRYKKPNRPCLFCGEQQSRLKRHILTKHMKDILKLHPKEIDHAIGQLRREAILAHNKKMIVQGNTNNIQREKNPINQSLSYLCYAQDVMVFSRQHTNPGIRSFVHQRQ